MKRIERLFAPLAVLIGLGTIALYLFWGNPDLNIVWHVRIPRLALTLLTGMSLAAMGSVYQLMLANPLAEPYILGVSSGSAFGSILVGSLGLVMLMPLGGFLGALLTMLVVWRLAQRNGAFDRSRLLIAGIIVGMFFSSAISLIMYLNKEDSVLILSTLMGNLGRVFTIGEWNLFVWLFLLCIAMLFYLYMQSRTLDIISGGDLYAGSVGIDVHKVRRRIFIVTSLLIGIVVSYAGIIGFVGLLIPHLVRLAVKTQQKETYLYSIVLGAIFLIIADFMAKSITAIELPVGVVTTAFGCPFFIWLLLRK